MCGVINTPEARGPSTSTSVGCARNFPSWAKRSSPSRSSATSWKSAPDVTFRTKIFVIALGTAALAVLVATLLVSWSVRNDLERRIDQELAIEARLAAELLSHREAATEAQLDAEADALGRILTARVTFIAPDGRVVGDSELTPEQI